MVNTFHIRDHRVRPSIRIGGLALLVLVAGMASSCSSMRDYTNSSPENLIVKPDIHSDSASMHVYAVDRQCNARYQGTVKLRNTRIKIGIPINKQSYLEFVFANASFFSGSHSISSGVYLTPRAGYQYEATVSYIDKMYSVSIYEHDAHGGARREISHFVPKACNEK